MRTPTIRGYPRTAVQHGTAFSLTTRLRPLPSSGKGWGGGGGRRRVRERAAYKRVYNSWNSIRTRVVRVRTDVTGVPFRVGSATPHDGHVFSRVRRVSPDDPGPSGWESGRHFGARVRRLNTADFISRYDDGRVRWTEVAYAPDKSNFKTNRVSGPKMTPVAPEPRRLGTSRRGPIIAAGGISEKFENYWL